MTRMPADGSCAAQTAPLSATRLRSALAGQDSPSGRGGFWSDVRVLAETGSTNEAALALARAGAPEGLVIAAETQTAGRGRQGRSWVSIPGASLTFSVLLRPVSVPQAALGWVPLLAGVAVATALRAATGSDARLKWPNDVLIHDAKLAGILAEQTRDAVVVGIGINVLGGKDDLPVPTATSLELHGAGGIDRTELLAGILREVERWYRLWRGTRAGDPDACGLRPEYLRLSATVGQPVVVQLPGGQSLAGTAADVDGAGRLLVHPDGGDPVPVSAGDVIHVR